MKPGLSPSEWQQLRGKERSYLEEAVTTVTPFTGISANALGHLRDDWISWRDDFVHIIVPAEDSCNNYKISGTGQSNGLPMYEHRESPCVYCRTTGETGGFENLQTNPAQSVRRGELIVHHEIATPAYEFLEKVFRTYDRPEIGVTPQAVINAAQRVIDTSQDDFTYSKLKRTAPVLYAYYDLDCDEIDRLTTFSSRSIKKIVRRTPELGVNFTQVPTAEFLRVISEKEPVTVNELTDELNLTKQAGYNRLNKLKQEDKITVSNGGHGPPTATYSTTAQWNEPFRCSECDFTTHSLGGIRKHRAAMHDQD